MVMYAEHGQAIIVITRALLGAQKSVGNLGVRQMDLTKHHAVLAMQLNTSSSNTTLRAKTIIKTSATRHISRSLSVLVSFLQTKRAANVSLGGSANAFASDLG